VPLPLAASWNKFISDFNPLHIEDRKPQRAQVTKGE